MIEFDHEGPGLHELPRGGLSEVRCREFFGCMQALEDAELLLGKGDSSSGSVVRHAKLSLSILLHRVEFDHRLMGVWENFEVKLSVS